MSGSALLRGNSQNQKIGSNFIDLQNAFDKSFQLIWEHLTGLVWFSYRHVTKAGAMFSLLGRLLIV